MAFILAQSEDEDASVSESGTGNEGGGGIEELDSKEFIEAIAHIAHAKYADETGIGLGDKIILVIETMTTMQQTQAAAAAEREVAVHQEQAPPATAGGESISRQNTTRG